MSRDDLWQAFEALANTYPHDDGVRLTAHLARWMVEEHQRLQVPLPDVLQETVGRVGKLLEQSPVPPAGRLPPLHED